VVAQLPPLPSYFLIPFLLGSAAAATATRSSSNHPPIVLHSKFLSHLHCPYAHTWLRAGGDPERASIELPGLEKSSFDGGEEDEEERRPTAATAEGRELFGVLPPDGASSKGTCVFANAFTNDETCTQYHGEGWTTGNTAADSMEAMCAAASDDAGVFTSDVACATSSSTGSSNLAGWCAVDASNGDGTKVVFTQLSISPMADCAGNEMACTTWVAGGVFIPDGACGGAAAGDGEGGEDDAIDALAAMMANPIVGRCTYTYTISNGTSCFEFRGEEWTDEDMANQCALGESESGENGDESDAAAASATVTSGGVLLSTTAGLGCAISEDAQVAGWCDETIDDGKHEVTLMIITDGADCAANEMVCTAFKGGVFGPDGACAGGRGGGVGGDDGTNTTSSTTTTTTTDEVNEEAYDELASALSSENNNNNNDDVTSSLSQLDIPGANDDTTLATEDDDDDDTNKCQIAPGAIGSAHQAGYSKGYSTSCPNTPGESSPYMWPLAWSAETESKSMMFGSDDVVYTSRGTTYYMLDKNWKRSDTSYRKGTLCCGQLYVRLFALKCLHRQYASFSYPMIFNFALRTKLLSGLLRTIGQGPCENIDADFAEEGFLGCQYNDTDREVTTMIHRENLMYFISWNPPEDDDDVWKVGETDASRIAECSMIDLVVIGNIRPDWFLDKRGDDTDVQYLGNQHVYYTSGNNETVPKLVKQWRKRDFASMYFTMSMMENPTKQNASVQENTHWPLILNIPGEGFGDDFLQVYRNHQLLSEDDMALFKVIEEYQSLGGVCVDVGAGGAAGPPLLEEEDMIPSNLKLDPMSWFSNEYTFSPIWTEQTLATTSDQSSSTASSSSSEVASTSSGMSVIEMLDRLSVESCIDGGSLEMAIHFHNVMPATDGLLPWMAIGYRKTELCAMTPIDGGTTPIILLTQSEKVGSIPEAYKTELFPQAKSADEVILSTMMETMTPLADEEGYSDVLVTTASSPAVPDVEVSRSSPAEEEGTVSLHFKQVLIDSTVDKMYYTFAIGTTSELGYHVTRGCFEVIATPCGQEMSGGDSGENAVVQGTDVLSSSLSDIVDWSRAVFAVLAIVSAVLIGQ